MSCCLTKPWCGEDRMKKTLFRNNLFITGDYCYYDEQTLVSIQAKENICSTLGSTTIIVTDTCGTITKNVMNVTDILVGNKTYNGTTKEHVGKLLKDLTEVDNAVLELLAHNISINSSDSSQLEDQAEVYKKRIKDAEDYPKTLAAANKTEDADDKKKRLKSIKEWKEGQAKRVLEPKEQLGNKTECSLLGLVEAMGQNYTDIRNLPKYAAKDGLAWGRNAGDGTIIHGFKYAGKGNPPAFPFSSSRKRMSWLVPHDDNKLRMHTKGASEVVLARCTMYLDENNVKQDMTEAFKMKVLGTINDFRNQGKRTLVTAYRDFDQVDVVIDLKAWDPESKMIFLCCVAIRDTLRPGTKSAVDRCRESGITSIMISGDALNATVAVAIETGIIVGANPMAADLQRLSNENIAMTGKDFGER